MCCISVNGPTTFVILIVPRKMLSDYYTLAETTILPIVRQGCDKINHPTASQNPIRLTTGLERLRGSVR